VQSTFEEEEWGQTTIPPASLLVDKLTPGTRRALPIC